MSRKLAFTNSLALLAGAVLSLHLLWLGVQQRPVHPLMSYWKDRLLELDPRYRSAMDHIVAEIEAQPARDRSARLAQVRHWVYDNSVHRIDAEHAAYAFQTSKVIPLLWNARRGVVDPPHLSCGPRAYAMKAILSRLHIDSRVIEVFTSVVTSSLQSHTFLEVWNEETGRWEIHDPDYDLTYIDRETREAVDIHRLVFGNPDGVLPISESGEGWEQLKMTQFKTQFLQSVLYRYDYDGRDAVLMVNSDRFDLSKRIGPRRQSLTEIVAEEHFGPIVIISSAK